MKDLETKITELLTKGVFEIFPNTDFLASQLRSGKKLTLYAGFDPTAPTLHLGHTIQLRKLRQFQDLGHQIIFLIGDFTALIGDPTDKLAARTQLTEVQVKQNLKKYKSQAGKIIRFSGKNKALVKFNSTWLKNMKLKDVLGLSSLVTVDQMLKRDMFERRIQEEKPIHVHEFMYPLMQGYDSVAMKVDGEVGGSDQTFNMLMGRTLEQKLLKKEKFVVTLKLLEDGTGKKMGKSEGNMVTLDDTPENMYGKIMSWPDSIVAVGLELLTNMSTETVHVFLAAETHPKNQKMKLAFEVVTSLFGQEKAQAAQGAFIKTFQKKEIPKQAQEIPGSSSFKVLLVSNGVVSSNTEARRLTDAGAIVYLETEQKITIEELEKIPRKGTYRVGKSRFIKII